MKKRRRFIKTYGTHGLNNSKRLDVSYVRLGQGLGEPVSVPSRVGRPPEEVLHLTCIAWCFMHHACLRIMET